DSPALSTAMACAQRHTNCSSILASIDRNVLVELPLETMLEGVLYAALSCALSCDCSRCRPARLYTPCRDGDRSGKAGVPGVYCAAVSFLLGWSRATPADLRAVMLDRRLARLRPGAGL